MQRLIQGIHEFQQNYFRPLKGLFEQLAHGQNPDTLFVTCSDSRIDPNLLTKSKPGELFILRNAGNIIPPHGAASGGEAATIEFAVSLLGVKDLIICGHYHCGAMKALLQPEAIAPLADVAAWLRHAEATRRIVRDNYSHLDSKRQEELTVEENVLVQLENVQTLPAVASRLRRGNLHLHGWVYRIETGEVYAYDTAIGQFVPLDQYQHPASEEVAMRRTTHAI
jgi:carbonic anhydrase